MLVVRTPLRLSFNGGGTDFEDYYTTNTGAVLSATINRSVYVIIKARFDDMIYLNWSKKEIVDDIDSIEHELIREALRLTGVTKGVEITTLSDVPSTGSGLGSSSSITVGLLHALYAYRNQLAPAKQLAEEACRIEIEILGKPIGRQDQYAAAYGGFNTIEFTGRGVDVAPAKLSRAAQMVLSEHLLLFHTGILRDSESVLRKQKDVASETGNSVLLKERAELAHRTRIALEQWDLPSFAGLLGSGWEMKRQLNPDTSNPDVDALYRKALDSGALSGKVVGAGGGGFMLLFVPLDRKATVRAGLSALKELTFEFTEYGSKIIFDYREV